jgi:hypothetical protein
MMIDNPCLLFYELARGEDGEVRDAAHGKSRGELLMFVSVDFEDDSLTGHVLCCARDFRGGSVARTTPFGPEVYEDRNAGALDNLVEECGIDLQWFVEWG